MPTVVVNIVKNYIIFASNHKEKAIHNILDILNGTNS